MKVRTRPLLLVAALLAGTVVPLAAPAAADSGPVPLGMDSFARIVADEANGRLFLSPGPRGTGIRVTDLQGGGSTIVDGLPGATGMALTPDGGSLWVALPGVGALAELDTATLAITQTITVPTGQCPGDVAVVGDRLVYGHSCNTYGGGGGYGGLGVVDTSTGAIVGGVTSGPYYRPVLATGPAGHVYAADAELSPATLYLYDVRGSAPVLVASRWNVCENLRDLSAHPDGSRVVTACGYPYQHGVWSADKLAAAGSFASGAYPLAGAWSGDGTTFVAGLDSAYEPDVVFHRLGQDEPVRWAELGGSTAILQSRGLAASSDGRRAWAVASSSSGLVLHVLDLPSADDPTLTVTTSPDALYAGEPVTVSGRLATVTGAPLTGEVLEVTRAATGAAPVSLPSVTTTEDGTFSLADTPPGAGSYVYAVTRAADGVRGEATALVWRTEPSLYLDLSRGTAGGDPVQGNLLLYYDGPTSSAGRTISLVREGGGMQVTLPSVVTDAQGHAAFTDTPPAGDMTYIATVAANGIHPSGTVSRTTTVLTATTLTAEAPAASTAGTPVRVTGVLNAPAGPVVGATVSVTRVGCGTSWTATSITTPNGSWAVSDPAAPVGSCTYRANYAGGDGYASSTASATTTVTLRPTALTAVAPGTALAGPVAVSGTLTSGSTAVPGAAVLVSRSGCSTWSGSVTTGADGSWSVTDPSVPAGTCTWKASYAGSATDAPSSASTSTVVSLNPTGLSLSVVQGTGRAKKSVVITAQLTSGSTSNRTVTLTAQPAGGAEVVLVSGTVDSTGKLTATYTPRTTTTYRATYAGDAYYAPASAERTQ